ncbi:MAG: hydroxyethylthiazole kinase, partial [Mangrovicoccus sp.]
PLVHCITNYVAMNYAANVLLAAGASPAMIHTVEETADFAPICAALTVNIGTLSPPWVAGMTSAIKAATAAGKPWVLDPVAHFATPYRAQTAANLLLLKPTVLRGNASEILAFTGADSQGQGVDSGDEVAVAEAGARSLAQRVGCVVAVTGEVDFVTDGNRAVRITGGSPHMPNVTATGCALSALIGGYLGTSEDPLSATTAALVHFAEAGARAHELAEGPGSFSWRFLDALAAVEPQDLADSRVRQV